MPNMIPMTGGRVSDCQQYYSNGIVEKGGTYYTFEFLKPGELMWLLSLPAEVKRLRELLETNPDKAEIRRLGAVVQGAQEAVAQILARPSYQLVRRVDVEVLKAILR